jgi:hypothetical protein
MPRWRCGSPGERPAEAKPVATSDPDPVPLVAVIEAAVATGAEAAGQVRPGELSSDVAQASTRVTVLLLYEGDHLNRLWAWLGLGPRKPAHWAWRALLLPLVTWVPMALLALAGAAGQSSGRVDATNFFADFAAYAQFWLGLPLFVLAEAVISVSTRSASLEFAASGVIRPQDMPRLEALHHRLTALQRSGIADLICLLLGAALSFATVFPELHGAHRLATWHTRQPYGHELSGAGWWAFGFALPLLNYWWLRHIWKVVLWWEYLRAMSRFRLDLVATHPDLTGGIGFVSTVQGHFAWLLLAYGVTNVAATVGYELALEGADLSAPPVWGPLVGFTVGAPLLFLLPLFMFTRQLYRTKRAARRRYRRRAMEQARLFEADILPRSARDSTTVSGALDLTLMNQISRLFEASQQMRVVPFDWRSVTQLVGSTVGSFATLIPVLHLRGPLTDAFLTLQKIVASFFGH